MLALLAIGASLSAPRLATFFRGRSLDHEARRLLSLTHFGAARAASEGRPMSLWFDLSSGVYGLSLLGTTPGNDPRAQAFRVDADLAIELAPAGREPSHADPAVLARDRRTAPDIRFEPDGTIEPGSLPRVTLRQRDDSAIHLVLRGDGLRYELRRHHASPPP